MAQRQTERFTVVGIGEALFDIFPDRERLGGAPLNVALCADQLARAREGRGVLVSRAGQDELGDRMRDQLQKRGMSVDYLQSDPDRPTGRVYVDFDIEGNPTFQIVKDVAWDVIQFDFDIEDLAQRCEAACFGTLAQRDGQSRNAIHRFLDSTRRATLLFDVNLREGFHDYGVIHRSCQRATIVKLNDQELPIVAGVLGLGTGGAGSGAEELAKLDAQAKALLKQYQLEAVVLTRGAAGTRLYTASGVHDGESINYEPASDADPVGAGDACAAAILVARVLRFPPQRIVDLANHCGAYVASQPGATPELPESILNMLRHGQSAT